MKNISPAGKFPDQTCPGLRSGMELHYTLMWYNLQVVVQHGDLFSLYSCTNILGLDLCLQPCAGQLGEMTRSCPPPRIHPKHFPFPSFKTTSVAGPLWPGWQRRASKLLKGFWSASPSASTRISAFWQRCIGACSVKEKMGRWSLQIGSHAITPTIRWETHPLFGRSTIHQFQIHLLPGLLDIIVSKVISKDDDKWYLNVIIIFIDTYDDWLWWQAGYCAMWRTLWLWHNHNSLSSKNWNVLKEQRFRRFWEVEVETYPHFPPRTV